MTAEEFVKERFPDAMCIAGTDIAWRNKKTCYSIYTNAFPEPIGYGYTRDGAWSNAKKQIQEQEKQPSK